jgi:lysophospholipase L1-like esterase
VTRRSRSRSGPLRALPHTGRLTWLVAAALVVIAVVGLVTWTRRAAVPTIGPTAAAPTGEATAGLPVAVIGDSISEGTPYGGRGAANWTFLVGEARRWTVTDTAVGGTGYVNPGPSAPYAAAQLERVVAARPRLVIVEGSRNDIGFPVDRIRDAARGLYRQLRDRIPGVRLVVIGPFWNAGTSVKAFAVRDALASEARDAGATFVDPMAEQWFTDAYGTPLIGADDVHPTDAGHALYARRLAPHLDRLGV